ncbi:hypothetical protein V6Z11_A06G119400 [Gossypium hirsutum]
MMYPILTTPSFSHLRNGMRTIRKKIRKIGMLMFLLLSQSNGY